MQVPGAPLGSCMEPCESCGNCSCQQASGTLSSMHGHGHAPAEKQCSGSHAGSPSHPRGPHVPSTIPTCLHQVFYTCKAGWHRLQYMKDAVDNHRGTPQQRSLGPKKL